MADDNKQNPDELAGTEQPEGGDEAGQLAGWGQRLLTNDTSPNFLRGSGKQNFSVSRSARDPRPKSQNGQLFHTIFNTRFDQKLKLLIRILRTETKN